MAFNTKILGAFSAMRVLGIPEEAVKPALKKLLDLYDGNWGLIEAENYRVLADAVFEYEEAKGLENNEGSVSHDESEPPCKRSHQEQQGNHVSSIMEMSSKVLVPKNGDIALKVMKQERMDSFRASLNDQKRVTTSDSHHEQFNDKRKCTTSSQISAQDVKPTSERASSNMHIKQPTGDSNGALIIGSSMKSLKKTELMSSSDSFVLDVVRSKVQTRCTRSSFHIIDDITKGAEKVKISLVDEIGTEGLPKFSYLPENTAYESAYLHFSLARISDEDCCSSCSGDCLSSLVPCACSRETGGEFAYTSRGLLRTDFLNNCISMSREPQKHHYFYCQDCPLERSKNQYLPDPCKGHLVRKFIKECWRKCGCSMYCGNRIVQHGITCKLQVFMTNEGKGWGLRTLEALPKGAFVCEYAGEILTNTELYERNRKRNGNDRHTYPVLLDADWGSEGVLKDEEALCLDATFYGNVSRFINHRCFDANLMDIPVEIESADRHYYHIAFFTKRNVDALEELTWDYAIDFSDENHPIKAFQCCCGSEFCRDMNRKGIKASDSTKSVKASDSMKSGKASGVSNSIKGVVKSR